MHDLQFQFLQGIPTDQSHLWLHRHHQPQWHWQVQPHKRHQLRPRVCTIQLRDTQLKDLIYTFNNREMEQKGHIAFVREKEQQHWQIHDDGGFETDTKGIVEAEPQRRRLCDSSIGAGGGGLFSGGEQSQEMVSRGVPPGVLRCEEEGLQQVGVRGSGGFCWVGELQEGFRWELEWWEWAWEQESETTDWVYHESVVLMLLNGVYL